ncbi:MAG: DUF3991 and TOPRIM domain-containing protein [Lachnospiraceae bacterium]|nr:DUF3991 and TOPRIM domain-containing protein [Lachnospiraceae bacterium]MBQ9200651.1 DUF3991 and TOPRIM domain-containing protein [Lachnospiraceae bacterium]
MPKLPEDIIDQARHADLAEYLRTHGFELKREGKTYRVSGYDSGLIVTGYKWYWNGHDDMSGKAVDFLVKIMGMSFQKAVDELTTGNIPYLPDEPTLPEPTISANFQLPERANNEKRVIAYLCQQRKIQYDTVIKLIKSGKLYQDARGNCTFIITDWNGRTVGTETHGTGTHSRYKNSTKHTGYGFRLLCGSQPTGAMFFESAIDLLSYYQIFRKSLTHHYLISTAGTGNDRTIQVFHQQRPEMKICLCCDNDQAGEKLIQKVHREIDSQAFIHRPQHREDWNDVLRYGDR